MKKIFKIQLLTGFLLLSSVGLLHGGAMLRRAQEYVDAVEKDAVLVASEEIMRLEANRLGFSYLKAIAFGGNLTELDNQVLSLKGSWSDYVKSMIKNDLIGKITKDGFFVSLSILPSWLSPEFSRFLMPLRGDVNGLAQGYLASKMCYIYVKKEQTDFVKAAEHIAEQLPKAFISDLTLGVNPWWFGMVSMSDAKKLQISIKNLLDKKIKDSGYGYMKLKVGTLPGWLSEFENYTDRIVTDPMLADFVASQRSYTYVDKNSAVDQNQLNAERSKITELLKSCVKIENIQGDNVAQEIEYVLVDIGNFSDTT
ncbi:MAG: hypothetical protein NTZ68_02480, partial [Candidatus Dependentiae bacterium]|nr:hypothetical protein [Candidatus Dependentiae bacterium]